MPPAETDISGSVPVLQGVRPLIVTLGLDPVAQAWFEGARRRHFPAQLNKMPAHVSLFHALPGEQYASIRGRLKSLAESTPCFPLEVQSLQKLGWGVAYALQATELDTLHAQLRREWLEWLTPQDRQPFRPHVVVQNKVDPAAARLLYDKLADQFRPWQVEAVSLLLWHYEGGPWTAAGEFPFSTERV